MKSKFMVVILSVVLTFSAVMMVGCSGNGNSGYFTYTLSSDGTYYMVKLDNASADGVKDIVLKSEYKGKPVVLAEKAFSENDSIETVRIESSYKSLEKNTFFKCKNLKEVYVDGEINVSTRCFTYCDALEKITFGDKIKLIDKICVFECNSLKSVVIGNGCKSIEGYAFKDCMTLESVDIGDSVIEIGEYAFAGCMSLSSVKFGKSLQTIGKSAFSQCVALKELALPTQNVLTISDYAFEYVGLDELHIPANLRLGEYSFGHLNWDYNMGLDGEGESRCKAVYFYSTEPTKEYLGTNSIGYTWDRTAADDAELGDFYVYVPEGYESVYRELMINECDESWQRCVINANKLRTFC